MPRKRAGSAIGTGKVSGAGKGTGKDANINKGTGIATAWNPNTVVADVSAPVGIQASTTAPTAATLAPNPVLDTDLPNSTGIGMDTVGSNPSQGSHAKTNATTTSAGNAPVTAAPIATTSFVSPTTTAPAPALPSAISSPAPTPVLAAPAAPPASSSTPTAISAPESTPTAASTYGNTSATIPVTALPPSRTPPPPPYSPVTPMLGEHNASVAGEFPLLPPGLSLDNGNNVEFDGAGAQEQQQQQLQLSQQQPQQQQQQPEQDQQGQQKQQQQQPIFQPEPTLLPIDSSNPDALALRSALSILQLQRANTLRDMRALARLRQAANEDPMGFAELVASGALDRKESSGNGLFRPGGWNDDQDEEEAGEGADDGEDKNQADANCHMDVDSTAVTDAHQPAARFPKLPHLPTPQAVVRMPPVNWAKYHIAAEPLERLHAQQRRRPDPGQPRRGADGDGDSMAGHGGAAVSDLAAAAGAAPAPAPGNQAHAQAPTSASTVSASAPTTAAPQSTAAATTPAPTPTTTCTAAAAAAAFAPPAQDHVIAAPYRPFEESLAGEPPPPAAVPGGGGATGIGAGGYGAAPMVSTVPISGVAATGGGQMQTRRTARTRQSVVGRAAG